MTERTAHARVAADHSGLSCSTATPVHRLVGQRGRLVKDQLPGFLVPVLLHVGAEVAVKGPRSRAYSSLIVAVRYGATVAGSPCRPDSLTASVMVKVSVAVISRSQLWHQGQRTSSARKGE